MSNYSCLKNSKLFYLSKIIFVTLFMIILFTSQIRKANSEMNNKLPIRNLESKEIEVFTIIFFIYIPCYFFLLINVCIFTQDEIHLPDAFAFLYLANIPYVIFYVTISLLSTKEIYKEFFFFITLIGLILSTLQFIISTIIIIKSFCKKCPKDIFYWKFLGHLYCLPWKLFPIMMNCTLLPSFICEGCIPSSNDPINNCDDFMGVCFCYLIICLYFLVTGGACFAVILASIIVYNVSLIILMIFWLPIKLILICCGAEEYNDNNKNNERYTLFIYEKKIPVSVKEENGKTDILVSQRVSKTVVDIDANE